MKKFVVTACRDFIEGYGPFDLQGIFNTYEEAYDFVQAHPGIYGTDQHKEPSVYPKDFGIEELFNGYVITIIERENLIKKLKETEKEDEKIGLVYVNGYWKPTTKHIIFQ